MHLLADTALVLRHELGRTVRNPVWVASGLFQPVLYLLLFAPLLDGLDTPAATAGSNTLAFFTPGVLVILALFGSIQVGFGVIAELRAGVLERLAVTPASRTALLAGRILRDVTILLTQSVLVVTIGALLGLSASTAGVAISLLLVTLIGTIASAWSHGLALATRDENGLAAVQNFMMLPLLLLSGVLLPISLGPGWIRTIATLNPFLHTVDAIRALFAGQLADPVVPVAFAVTAAIAAALLWWATRSLRHLA